MRPIPDKPKPPSAPQGQAAPSAGDEAQVVRHVGELAGEPGQGLTWFDAALVCHQLGAGLRDDLERLRAAVPTPTEPRKESQ